MQYDAGIDVSLEQSSVCVVDATGKIVKYAKVATDPHVLATLFKGLGLSAHAHRARNGTAVAVVVRSNAKSRIKSDSVPVGVRYLGKFRRRRA
jgi:predicted NBD/HSP70 family sugar kinase